MQHLDRGWGDLHRVNQSDRQLITDLVLARDRKKCTFTQVILTQERIERGPAELAIGTGEALILREPVRQDILRQSELQLPRMVVDCRPTDQLRQHLLVETGGARLLCRDAPAEPAAKIIELGLIGLLEVGSGDFGFADACERAFAIPAERAGDPPESEAHDQ